MDIYIFNVLIYHSMKGQWWLVLFCLGLFHLAPFLMANNEDKNNQVKKRNLKRGFSFFFKFSCFIFFIFI